MLQVIWPKTIGHKQFSYIKYFISIVLVAKHEATPFPQTATNFSLSGSIFYFHDEAIQGQG